MKEKLLLDNKPSNSTLFSIFKKSNEAQRLVNRMERFYKKKKSNQFKDNNNKNWLINGLEKEFSRILINEKARIGASLKNDSTYKEAVELLLDLNSYYSLLGY